MVKLPQLPDLSHGEGTEGLHPFVLAFIEEQKIPIQNLRLLQAALTHPTYAFEHPGSFDYERLEFLGDAVLELVVSDLLFREKKKFQEGQLSKIRSSLVCEANLVRLAHRRNLGQYMLLGHGEERTGGREKASNLADCYEALLAAVYLDQGFLIVKDFVLKELSDFISPALEGRLYHDFKSRLLELAQAEHIIDRLQFKIIREYGPVHAPTFEAAVYFDDAVLAKASGKSKKAAEQAAAEIVLGLPEPFQKEL